MALYEFVGNKILSFIDNLRVKMSANLHSKLVISTGNICIYRHSIDGAVGPVQLRETRDSRSHAHAGADLRVFTAIAGASCVQGCRSPQHPRAISFGPGEWLVGTEPGGHQRDIG